MFLLLLLIDVKNLIFEFDRLTCDNSMIESMSASFTKSRDSEEEESDFDDDDAEQKSTWLSSASSQLIRTSLDWKFSTLVFRSVAPAADGRDPWETERKIPFDIVEDDDEEPVL